MDTITTTSMAAPSSHAVPPFAAPTNRRRLAVNGGMSHGTGIVVDVPNTGWAHSDPMGFTTNQNSNRTASITAKQAAPPRGAPR